MTLKKEMKARLRSDPNQFEQTVFEFEQVNGEPVAPSFEWEEEGDEFRYNGSIYDVIEKKITGNLLQIRCIDDQQEAGIIKKIEDLQKNTRRNNKSRTAPLHQLLSLLLFNQHEGYQPANLFSFLHHIDHYTEFFNTIVIDITTPPPRRVTLSFC